jgi:methionine sulfoxide reductase heme-binding subunit
MARLRRDWLQILAHVLSLLPLGVIAWDFSRGQLTANPIQEITLRTGMYSLVLLVLSLACTPAANLSAQHSKLKDRILRLRRPLGLYGFFYAALHTLNFVGVDYRFDLALLRADVFGKAHTWAGLAALLLLVPAAATSAKGWAKRLGKNWERLHWLVYPAALLSVLHFLLLVKHDLRPPMLWGAVVVALLVARLKPVRNLWRKKT